MKKLVACLVLMALSAAAADEGQALDGGWTVTAAEYQKGSLSHLVGTTLVVNDNVMVLLGKVRDFEKTDEGLEEAICGWGIKTEGESLTLLKGTDPVGKGIFKIKGDTLTLCVSFKGEQPGTFATDAKNHHQLLSLQRMR